MPQNEASLLEVRNVRKTFDSVVRALWDVSFSVYPNEIVGVVGENGAGKSTLMKILVGVFPPDSGEMYHLGSKVPFPKNPREAARRGVSLVPQEKGVVMHLRVYQFLFLGHEDEFTSFWGLKTREMKRLARDILKELHIDCDVDSFMYDLSLPLQKLVEIAKAILTVRLRCKDPDITPIIILDEPTAPLAVEQREQLFEFIMKAKKTSSFIFVSHIIPEILNFADRIYVLRDGKVVAYHDSSSQKVTEEDIFKEIVGRSASEYLYKTATSSTVRDRVCLSVKNLTKKGYYYDISFDLHEGECIGLFGTAGSGKVEIVRTLAGSMDFDDGSIVVDGHSLKGMEASYVGLKYGIGYFSGETGKELFLNWSIARNISILNLEKILKWNGLVISPAEENELAEEIMRKLRIKAPNPQTECYSLSGGNKQKVSVGKWMEKSPRILLLEDPTIGIDVGAREDIYEALLEMKKNGIAMILVSDDPKEYLLLCDRIAYIKSGRIEKIVSPEEFEAMIKEE